jgi:hypothetical protein
MIEAKHSLKSVWQWWHGNNRYFTRRRTSYQHRTLGTTEPSERFIGIVETSARSFAGFDIVETQSSNIGTNDNQFVYWTIIETSYNDLLDDGYCSDDLKKLLGLLEYADLVVQTTANKNFSI